MIRAIAVAGLIGGCADWFAVVAIFRHPFGLRIPYTAVIPNSKDRIADNIEDFLAKNFSDGKKTSEYIKNIKPAKQLADWLMQTENTEIASRYAVRYISSLMTTKHDPIIRNWLIKTVVSELKDYNILPIGGKILKDLYNRGQHHEIIDLLLNTANSYLENNPGLFVEEVSNNSGWLVPKFADRYLAETLEDGLKEKIEQMEDRDDPTRLDIERHILDLIQRLESGNFDTKKITKWWNVFISSPLVRRQVEELYQVIKSFFEHDGHDTRKVEAEISRILRVLAQELKENTKLHQEIDAQLPKLAEHLASEGGMKLLAKIIGNTVKGWTGEKVAEELEDAVGEHMQFIRINGTILGGILGFIISGIEQTVVALA